MQETFTKVLKLLKMQENKEFITDILNGRTDFSRYAKCRYSDGKVKQ
jgi:hypothetical protein